MLLGVAVSISSFRLTLYRQTGPAPGFMGLLTGALLFGISLHLLLKNWFLAIDEGGRKVAFPNLKLNLLVMGAMFFYALTLERLGFVISVFILLSVLLAVSKTLKWHVIVGTSMLVTFAGYILFSMLLGIGLPLGVLSFLR